MKMISAIIRPNMLERLSSSLRKAQVPGITVLKAEGFGREHSRADLDLVGYLQPRIKVEIAVQADEVDAVIDVIQQTVSTQKDGDGMIFVFELEGAVRLGSGERGRSSLT
jgi:nitrogen regulatory protein P-II 2